MEKARRHHNSKQLSKTMRAWNKHHYQLQKNKVLKSLTFISCYREVYCLTNVILKFVLILTGDETTGNLVTEIENVPEVL